MGMNPIVDNAASQRVAVAANNSAVADMKALIQKDLEKTNTDKVKSESNVGKLLQDATNPSKAGLSILVELAGKMATLGVNLKPEKFGGKADEALENELEQMQGKAGQFADLADIREMVGRVSGRNKGKEQGQGEQKGDNQNHSPFGDKEVQATVREYSAVYAQYTVGHTPELKKKLDKLEVELQQKGLTAKDLNSIRNTTSNAVRKELAQQVKDAYFKQILSDPKSVERALSGRQLDDALNLGLNAGVHDDESLQQLVNDTQADMKEELRDFSRQKVEEKMVGKFLAADAQSEKPLQQDLKKMVELAASMGVDLKEFSRQWETSKIHMGLYVFDPAAAAAGAGANPDSRGQQGNSGQSGPSQAQEEEKDLMAGRLRAVFMHRALSGDWKTALETSFKMRRLKNGLLKLGVSSNEMAQVEKEGYEAARQKLLEMLRGTLEEKATLYDLSGPAFKMIEGKIASLLGNLDRLGWRLDELEYGALRDEANIKVFEMARHEVLTIKEMLGGGSDRALEKRLKLLLKVMKRVKAESKLAGEIPADIYQIKEAV
jgi:hypothetical protein